jgi:hypothetical protein
MIWILPAAGWRSSDRRHVEGNLLPFAQHVSAGFLDLAGVDEDVAATLIGLDESEPTIHVEKNFTTPCISPLPSPCHRALAFGCILGALNRLVR